MSIEKGENPLKCTPKRKMTSSLYYEKKILYFEPHQN
jgi:hypothetical protein